MSEAEGHSELDGPPEFQRALADRTLSRIEHTLQFASDQVGSMAKWLMASLLAVNGAGGLAVLSSINAGHEQWLTGALFVLGVISALLVGVAMQEVYIAMPDSLLLSDRYWIGVSISGDRDPGRESELKSALAKAARFSFVPPLLGWVSGLLFLAGTISMALHADPSAREKAAACEALRKDMLSAHPKRGNGIELLAPLGCRTNGKAE
jgi:hypothetical protein